MKNKRNLVVILGSENDLKQCEAGLMTLQAFERQNQNQIKLIVHIKNAHRHTSALQDLLTALSKKREPYVIIAAAGMAAILPGSVDSYLRYELKNTTIPVVGVALKGKNEEENLAATLSITKVPKTQVIFAGEGTDGFHQACVMFCERENYPEITLPKIPPSQTMSVGEALEIAKRLNQQP